MKRFLKIFIKKLITFKVYALRSFNYLVLFLIFIPIFFGYDFQEAAFVTDINILVSERVLSFPSFPVGIGIVLVGFFLILKKETLYSLYHLIYFLGFYQY